jgi:hypothetical protein
MLNEVKHLIASHCDLVEMFHVVQPDNVFVWFTLIVFRGLTGEMFHFAQHDKAFGGDSPRFNFELFVLNS